jgi:hypothetical protein
MFRICSSFSYVLLASLRGAGAPDRDLASVARSRQAPCERSTPWGGGKPGVRLIFYTVISVNKWVTEWHGTVGITSGLSRRPARWFPRDPPLRPSSAAQPWARDSDRLEHPSRASHQSAIGSGWSSRPVRRQRG